MLSFPAFISPAEGSIFLSIFALPIAVIILLVWFVKKLNSIDNNLAEIRKLLEKQKINDR